MDIYVNIKAKSDGDGSRTKPFRSISEAAAAAGPGDTVRVAPGIYREAVDPLNSGTGSERITYVSTEPLAAVITGAERISSWEQYTGDVWAARVDNRLFGEYNPYTTLVYGDWYFAKADKHTGCVYLNDEAMYETSGLEECMRGEISDVSWDPDNSRYKWYTEQDEERDETLIYANFQGLDPNREKVEINVRRECFWPSETGRNYITVRGFKVEKAATTWAPPAAFQDGMIGPHWSRGWIIEDCEIVNSKCAGISLGRYYDPDNDNYFSTKYVKSPTQMERDSVCRGQYHGWLKENIGGHIIRRNNIHHCQQGGIIGRMGGVFSVIEDNHIHHINNMMELGGAEIAGIKLHAAIDVIIRKNHIHHCTMGIWCDWEAQGTRISCNYLHDNQRPEGVRQLKGGMMSQDLFVEVSHGPTLIDNNILMSDVSLRFAAQGIAMVHNLICGAFTCVGAGTDWRYTPYHIPHRTEVMGFMTILHGDNRFYNNIFIQTWPAGDAVILHDTDDGCEYENRRVGTWVFDEYPTYEEWYSQFDFSGPANMSELEKVHFGHLPVWSEGNIYLNGAKACRQEKKGKCRMITSDILGKAFEPEQRFELPDGSDLILDTDYFGDLRTDTIIPGPFASLRADAHYYDMEFHRGGRDARPENTLWSYQYALENGALTIECDMQLTGDGQIVMSHNPELNPDLTTDSEGRRIEGNGHYIHDMTLQEVQSFNVGRMDPSVEYYELHGRTQVQTDAFIPSLRQMFELVRDSGNEEIRMSIEAKAYPDPALGTRHEKNPDYDKLLEEFLALVNEFGFRDRVILQSFDWLVLVKMKELDPGIRTIALYSEQPSWGTPDATTLWLDREEPSPWLAGLDIHEFGGDPVRAAHSLGIDDVSPYFKEITKELTDEAHELGMRVVPWTVSFREDMEVMYEMGVDGIITDRPWVLREFLEEKGEKLPAPGPVDLPYHLEPDHYMTDGRKSENGRDAAY